MFSVNKDGILMLCQYCFGRALSVHFDSSALISAQHAAPVLSVMILDGRSRPFPPPLAVKKELAPAPDTSAPHKVLICSEEQFKVGSPLNKQSSYLFSSD